MKAAVPAGKEGVLQRQLCEQPIPSQPQPPTALAGKKGAPLLGMHTYEQVTRDAWGMPPIPNLSSLCQTSWYEELVLLNEPARL